MTGFLSGQCPPFCFQPRSALWEKKQYQEKHPPFIYRKVGQNDEKLRGLFEKLQNIAVYCLYVKLAGDFRMLPGKWKNLKLTIVLFLMFVRKKTKKSMCVWGLCMRVFNFITRQNLQKWKSKKKKRKKKQWRKRKATSHLQPFYAMNRKAETQKEKQWGEYCHNTICFVLAFRVSCWWREFTCLCMLVLNIEM